MDSNTHSNQSPPSGRHPADASGQPPVGPPDRLASLVAANQELAAEDLDGLADSALAEDAVRLEQLLDSIAGQWLRRVAAVDARAAAGADQDQQALSTASWLRNRLRMGVGTASSSVRTARALFRGPLQETAAALTAGDISPAHAQVVAQGTQDLPEHLAMDADPILAEAARRLDPAGLRRLVAQLVELADPEGADAAAERRHERRGLWLSPTWQGMVAVNGLLESEAASIVQAALEPLARPAEAGDDRKGSQRTADALTELCGRALEAGELPKTGGVRPQLLVTVDLATLVGHRGGGGVGGQVGWADPLSPEACRRLACDAAVTRVLVTRQPGHRQCGDHDGAPAAGRNAAGHEVAVDPRGSPPTVAGCGCPTQDHPGTGPFSDEPVELQGRLRAAAITLLPPILGGTPSRPLDVGRSTRVVSPAQRSALAVRDGGCVFPACDRPLAWCEGHHLISWLNGGPTDLANLALLCRAHHRAVHEGGWQLTRGPDGRFSATPPPHRRHRAA